MDGRKEVSNCSNESKLSFKVLVGKCFHEAETQYIMFEGKTGFFQLACDRKKYTGDAQIVQFLRTQMTVLLQNCKNQGLVLKSLFMNFKVLFFAHFH